MIDYVDKVLTPHIDDVGNQLVLGFRLVRPERECRVGRRGRIVGRFPAHAKRVKGRYHDENT